jgi:hypothetical protein
MKYADVTYYGIIKNYTKNSQARNYFNFDKSLRHHVNVHWYARYDAHSEHFILHDGRLDVT